MSVRGTEAASPRLADIQSYQRDLSQVTNVVLFHMTTEPDYSPDHLHRDFSQCPLGRYERIDASHLKNRPNLISEVTTGATS